MKGSFENKVILKKEFPKRKNEGILFSFVIL